MEIFFSLVSLEWMHNDYIYILHLLIRQNMFMWKFNIIIFYKCITSHSHNRCSFIIHIIIIIICRFQILPMRISSSSTCRISIIDACTWIKIDQWMLAKSMKMKSADYIINNVYHIAGFWCQNVEVKCWKEVFIIVFSWLFWERQTEDSWCPS